MPTTYPLLRLQHRQDVARRVFEPGDLGAVAARDAALVLVDSLVALELDAARAQLVDRGAHVLDREVEDRVRGRGEVRLRVDHDRPVSRELESEDAHGPVADPQAERVAVEGTGGVDVRHREAAECFRVSEHVRIDRPSLGNSSTCLSIATAFSPETSTAHIEIQWTSTAVGIT